MNVPEAPTPTPAPVERKVWFASLGAFLALGAAGWALDFIGGNPYVLEPLPDPLEPVILAGVGSLAAFLAGYRARHTPRAPMARR